MQLQDRLRGLRRRRWLAAGIVLTLMLATAVALVTRGQDVDVGGSRPTPAVVPPTGPAAASSSGFEAATLRAAGWERAPGAKRQVTSDASLVGAGEARTGRSALRLEVGRDGAAPLTVRHAEVPVGQGLACDVGAWARRGTGEQRLTVSFLGADGRQVAGRDEELPPGSGVWSRVTIRALSPAGTTALSVSISAASGSNAYWDDMDMSCSLVPNGDFEMADATASSRVFGWAVIAGEDTSAGPVADGSGGRAMRVQDTSTSQGIAVRSQPTPVPSGLEVTVSAWVHRVGGDQEVVVRFLDVARRPVTHVSHLPLTTKVGGREWWSAAVSVPTLARWAIVELSSGSASRSTALWDDVDVRPTDPVTGRIGTAEAVSELTGYLSTMTSRTVTVAGRTLIYTIVSGSPAELQVADLATGRLVDRRAVPGAPTGWALATSPDQKSVYLGGAAGHLLRYDPRARTLTDLGRATPHAEVVFDLVVAPDGRVWGGSYPRGEVWVHDPRQAGFTTLSPLGVGREYARSLALDGTTLYVGTGAVRPSIVSINLRDPSQRREIQLPGSPQSGFVTELRSYGRLLAAKLPDGKRGVYDVQRASWDTPVSRDAGGLPLTQSPSMGDPGAAFYYFSNGRLWRVRPERPDDRAKLAIATSTIPPGRDRFVVRATLGGKTSDWLVSYDGARSVVAIDVGRLPDPAPGDDVPEARWERTTLQLDPRPLRIKSLGSGADGVLWVGGFGGASLSSLDTSQPAPSLVPRVGGSGSDQALVGFGEVEGLASNGPYEYFGTYTGARVFRYDTRRPWVDGANPRLVANLGPSWGQDRPIAWATSGDRTFFGTVPRYGQRGGVLGWFTGDGSIPVIVPSPVPEHSIVGLSAHRSIVYGATSRWGGLGAGPARNAPAVFAYDTKRRRTIWTSSPSVGLQSAGSVLVDRRGRLFALANTELVELNPANGQVIRRFPLGTGRGVERATFADTDLAEGGGRLWAATPEGLWAVDPGAGTFSHVVGRELGPPRVEFLADAVFFPAAHTLMRVAVP